MLPSLRHRLIIAGAILLGAFGFIAVRDFLTPFDLSSGISLFSARVPPVEAIGMAILAALPAAVLALFASASGHPLSGVFAMSMSLAVLAGLGGPIDGWMWRSKLPDAYGQLITEIVIWQAGTAVLLLAIQRLRLPLRKRFPALAFDDHLGMDTRLHFPGVTALLAGLVSAAVAALASFVLIRSSDTGQVIGAVLVAFTLGGLAGQSLFPQGNPVGILFSPAIVAVAAYVYPLVRFNSGDEVLAAWHAQKLAAALPGPSQVLPIFYASVGLAGCAMGIGIAHAFAHGAYPAEPMLEAQDRAREK